VATLIVRAGPRHARGGGESRRLAEGALGIGRAPGNDLVLADPYVGAAQFRLSRAGEDVVLEVLDRTNPVRVNGQRRDEATLTLASGDEIEIGHSLVTVLREDAVVAPTRVLPSTWWARLGSWRPAAAALALLAAAGTSLWVDFLATVDTPRWDELLSGTLTLATVLLGWAALWAVVGRSVRQQAHFAGHLALACAVVLAGFALSALIEYGLYALDAARFAEALDWAGGAALLFLLCYGEFRLATHLRRPAIAAVAAVLLPLATLAIFEQAAREDYDPQPQALTLLGPPFAKLAEGRSAEDHDELLAGLFEELRAD
jgi:hypothetical protein